MDECIVLLLCFVLMFDDTFVNLRRCLASATFVVHRQ